jgi:1-acyl-sn-glycerol-3-phosphate acyltransferase
MSASLRRITHFLYGGYAAVVFLGIIFPTLLLLVVTPGLQRRRRLAKWAAGAVFWSAGSPIDVDGAAQLDVKAAVVVANHSSYLDGVILTAALPVGFTFVIKKEMERMPLAGWLLRRLGSHFVDRDNREQRTRAARRLLRAAEAQDALVFFPEGTFDEQVGLKRFRPGAFRTARRADLPLIPVAIRGAREKLPSGRMLMAPGPLSVKVTAALNSNDYSNASTLAGAARQAILEIIREPDLDAN